MGKLSIEAEKIMIDRFGKDSIISLATIENNKPFVRSVNFFYDSGSSYIFTYGLSNKIKQIEKNPIWKRKNKRNYGVIKNEKIEIN